jgi:hypothetical protein
MLGERIVTEQMIEPLPPIVKKWLKRSNIIGREIIQTVHLQQKGEIRNSPNGRWMPFRAEQYNQLENPAFTWQAKVKAAPLILR